MAYSFIDKSVRTPSVATELDVNMASERFQNHNLNICPLFEGQDNLGRPANHNTFRAETYGCHDPLRRIKIQNHLRPNYAVYLNADGIDGDLQGQNPSFGDADYFNNRLQGRQTGSARPRPLRQKNLPSSRSARKSGMDYMFQDRTNKYSRRINQEIRYRNSD
jgi:hypothetical protein